MVIRAATTATTAETARLVVDSSPEPSFSYATPTYTRTSCFGSETIAEMTNEMIPTSHVAKIAVVTTVRYVWNAPNGTIHEQASVMRQKNTLNATHGDPG